jgi:hypothetical protein
VSDELRKVWVCVGCDMRARHASGRPIPQPAKWEDDRCPRCRLKLAFEEGGNEAEAEMAARLGVESRSRRAFAGRGLKGERPSDKPKKKQAHRSSEEVAVLRAKVKKVITAHPDWTGEQIGEAVGITTRTAVRYRDHLGLGRGNGPSGEKREQIGRALLTEAPKTDKEIAEAVGVKTFTVTDVRRRMEVPPYRTRVKEDRERRVAKVAAEHPDWGYKRIASVLGLPLNSTRRALDVVRQSDPAEPVSAAV